MKHSMGKEDLGFTLSGMRRDGWLRGQLAPIQLSLNFTGFSQVGGVAGYGMRRRTLSRKMGLHRQAPCECSCSAAGLYLTSQQQQAGHHASMLDFASVGSHVVICSYN